MGVAAKSASDGAGASRSSHHAGVCGTAGVSNGWVNLARERGLAAGAVEAELAELAELANPLEGLGFKVSV